MQGYVCDVCAWDLQKPEEDARLPGAGVAGGCEAMYMGAEN